MKEEGICWYSIPLARGEQASPVHIVARGIGVFLLLL